MCLEKLRLDGDDQALLMSAYVGPIAEAMRRNLVSTSSISGNEHCVPALTSSSSFGSYLFLYWLLFDDSVNFISKHISI